MEAHYYPVHVQWTQDRKGLLCSSDVADNKASHGCIEVATPPEFPQGIAGIWSPEHLFTASVASCLMTTFLAIAENSKLQFVAFACHAKGKLEKVDGKYRMTEVALEPEVTILEEKDAERAERILLKSETACLISNSITATVKMHPVIHISTVSSGS